MYVSFRDLHENYIKLKRFFMIISSSDLHENYIKLSDVIRCKLFQSFEYGDVFWFEDANNKQNRGLARILHSSSNIYDEDDSKDAKLLSFDNSVECAISLSKSFYDLLSKPNMLRLCSPLPRAIQKQSLKFVSLSIMTKSGIAINPTLRKLLPKILHGSIVVNQGYFCVQWFNKLINIHVNSLEHFAETDGSSPFGEEENNMMAGCINQDTEVLFETYSIDTSGVNQKNQNCGVSKSAWIESVSRKVGGYRKVILRIINALDGSISKDKTVKIPMLPKGILLTGNHGVGKTHLAMTIANESKLKVFQLNGAHIYQKNIGQSEGNMFKLFNDIISYFKKTGLASLLIVDGLDSLGMRRSEVQGNLERRLCSQLISHLDSIHNNNIPVGIISIACNYQIIDPSLLNPYRLGNHIHIPSPDVSDRMDILYTLLLSCLRHKNNNSNPPSSTWSMTHPLTVPEKYSEVLKYTVQHTAGFVGADLNALIREAVVLKRRHSLEGEARSEDNINVDIASDSQATTASTAISSMIIDRSSIDKALTYIDVSSLQQRASSSTLLNNQATVAKINNNNNNINQLQGIDSIIDSLKLSILYPLQHPGLWSRLGVSPPRGFVLYGPSGVGKTSLAKQMVHECRGISNLINISCPDIISKVVGESEQAIAKIFSKARAASPCILLLDQFECLAPKRSSSDGESETSSGTFDRILSTLLIEMDGALTTATAPSDPVSLHCDVIIIATTNRIESIDTAMLRPGRLDQCIEIPLPGEKQRFAILMFYLNSIQLIREVSKVEIAQTLARATSGLSGAQLENICREAVMCGLREDMNSEGADYRCFEEAMYILFDKEIIFE